MRGNASNRDEIRGASTIGKGGRERRRFIQLVTPSTLTPYKKPFPIAGSPDSSETLSPGILGLPQLIHLQKQSGHRPPKRKGWLGSILMEGMSHPHPHISKAPNNPLNSTTRTSTPSDSREESPIHRLLAVLPPTVGST